MTRDRDSGQLRSALGRSWSFVPSTRVVLAVGEGAGAPGSQRMARLAKSPRLVSQSQGKIKLIITVNKNETNNSKTKITWPSRGVAMPIAVRGEFLDAENLQLKTCVA